MTARNLMGSSRLLRRSDWWTLSVAAIVLPAAAAAQDTPEQSGAASGETQEAAAAQDAPGQSGAASGDTQEAAVDNSSGVNIIVTAQKREERLLQVAAPVSAIAADDLATNGQPTLRDYYARVPGLSLNAQGAYDGSTISIRGISSGPFNEGTTGVVVDDVPYNSQGQLGDVVPEIDPADLERIEVLRGPQGTLYGASSMGGLLKYVTKNPSTEEISGQVRGGLNVMTDSDDIGYVASGSINVPLGSTLAVRASASRTHTQGFYDNVPFDDFDTNWRESDAFRATALWRPSDNFSIKLGAYVQNVSTGGNAYASLLPGETVIEAYDQYITPNSTGSDVRTRIYSGEVRGAVGSVELTSITAYSTIDGDYISTLFPGLFSFLTFPTYGVNDVSIVSGLETEKFTQEVRAEIPITDMIDFRVGGFYSHEDYYQVGHFIAVDENNGDPKGSVLLIEPTTRFEQLAVFGDIVVRFSDRFDIQLGGRYSANKNEGESSFANIISGVTIVSPTLSTKDDAFTYLVSPRFKITPDIMVYGRFASGFRAGGPNANRGVPGVPDSYKPDFTYNYEVGFKGRLFDGILTVDTSLYHIDWKDIRIANQFTPPPLQVAYTANGGAAKSQGWEFAVLLNPGSGFTFNASGSVSRAELTEDFPSNTNVNPKTGDRLPYSPNLKLSFSADKEFAVSNDIDGYVGATWSYVGERANAFVNTAAGPREFTPGYDTTNLRVGLRIGDYWDINIYANNVFDQRGKILTGFGGSPPQPLTIYVEPRNVGFTTSFRF